MEIVYADGFVEEFVDIWCSYPWIPGTPQVSVALIICHDENDIRFLEFSLIAVHFALLHFRDLRGELRS